jgi:hypothetical protein
MVLEDATDITLTPSRARQQAEIITIIGPSRSKVFVYKTLIG